MLIDNSIDMSFYCRFLLISFSFLLKLVILEPPEFRLLIILRKICVSRGCIAAVDAIYRVPTFSDTARTNYRDALRRRKRFIASVAWSKIFKHLACKDIHTKLRLITYGNPL